MTTYDATRAHHPVVIAHHAWRTTDLQLRAADAITRFAGSMWFVYLHAIGFTVWIHHPLAPPPQSRMSSDQRTLDVRSMC